MKKNDNNMKDNKKKILGKGDTGDKRMSQKIFDTFYTLFILLSIYIFIENASTENKNFDL